MPFRTNSFTCSLILVPRNPPCYFPDQRHTIADTHTIPKSIFLSDLDIWNKHCVFLFQNLSGALQARDDKMSRSVNVLIPSAFFFYLSLPFPIPVHSYYLISHVETISVLKEGFSWSGMNSDSKYSFLGSSVKDWRTSVLEASIMEIANSSSSFAHKPLLPLLVSFEGWIHSWKSFSFF